jgi:hypothetical protein
MSLIVSGSPCDHLHEVVDDHVAKGTHGIVEVSATRDAEVLGHRDLHAVDEVAVPDGFEHGVCEPQVQDLLEAHLAEVVVDAVQLRFVHVLVQLGGERLCRREIVTERLLDDDTSVFVPDETGIGEAFHDRREQAGRGLEVEHR